MPPLQQVVADWINSILSRLGGKQHTVVIAFWKQTLSYAFKLKGYIAFCGKYYISLRRRDSELKVAILTKFWVGLSLAACLRRGKCWRYNE